MRVFGTVRVSVTLIHGVHFMYSDGHLEIELLVKFYIRKNMFTIFYLFILNRKK